MVPIIKERALYVQIRPYMDVIAESSIRKAKMAKRYFYTDHIKAHWMLREHNIKLVDMEGMDIQIFDYYGEHRNRICLAQESSSKWVYEGVHYIHPDSHAMLEPQVGDLLKIGEDSYRTCGKNHKGERMIYNDPWGDIEDQEEINSFSILQRNGKAFFMPECEEV